MPILLIRAGIKLARLEVLMDNEETKQPTTMLDVMRLHGESYERFLAISGSDGKQQSLTGHDLKYIILFVYAQMETLTDRFDDYESRGKAVWMGVAEAIKYVGCSRRTIYRGIKSGGITSKVENGRRVLQRSSVEKFARYRDC